MSEVEMFVVVGFAVGVGILALVSRVGGRDDGLDPEAESANWQVVDAEVISVLRASNRTFLLVRFPVGTSLIRNDVQYPLSGPAPHAGQQVPVKYDPAAPARIVFDLQTYRATAPRAPH